MMRLRLALHAGILSLAVLIGLLLVPTTAGFVDEGGVRAQFSSTPVRNYPFATISAGRDFTLAVATDHTLWAWGANDVGQLGDGSLTTRQSPVQVALPEGTEVVAASAGLKSSIALTSDGSVYTWGDSSVASGPNPARVSGISGVVSGVSAGGAFFLAWTNDGTLWSWGNNGSGRLGRGTPDAVYVTPSQVLVAGASSVVGASAGRYGAVAWRASGTVLAWGDQHNAVTGTTIGGVPSGQISRVVIGNDTKMLLMASGTCYWSRGTDAFTAQSGLPSIADISISLADSYDSQTQLALATDGRLYAWLDNSVGQYGDGTLTGQSTPRLISLSPAGSPQVAQVASGDNHTILRTSDGGYTGTGADDSGQLGNGGAGATTTYRPPLHVSLWP